MLLWAEEQNEERNPSLTAFTGHFNNVSGWCRTRLIESKDSKEREKVALKLLKVMRVSVACVVDVYVRRL